MSHGDDLLLTDVGRDKVRSIPIALHEDWEALEDTDDEREDRRSPCRVRLQA